MSNDFIPRKNVHQVHMMDLVLLGERGLNELNHKISNFISKMPEDKLISTQKIDGAPAVICWSKFPGYPDNSICLKSFVGGAKNALSSMEDIEAKYGDRPVMLQMLKYSLEIAPHIPSGEAWQGDCLFTKSSKKERDINGTNYLTFQPNKIIYAFSEDNPGYEQVKRADFGIAFHTIYRPGDNGEKSQSFDIDPSVLDVPDNIYIMSPSLGDVNKDNFNMSELESKFNELQSLEKKLIGNQDYENLIDNNLFMGYWNTFENANLSDKKANTINVNTFYKDLVDYIKTKRTGEYEKKVAGLKTDKGRASAKEKYDFDMSELEDILESNKELLVDLVKTLNCASEITLLLYNGFKQTQQGYSTFYQSRTKGYFPSEGEGISMSDSNGNIVKLVDRASFSNANRDPDIMSGFEHNESLDEELSSFKETYRRFARSNSSLEERFNRMLESDGRICVLGFGRMNPPTIGHKKLIDTIVNKAKEVGGEPRMYLSHTQDSKKNPLSYEQKLHYCQSAFGDVIKDSNAKTIINALSEVYNDGFDEVIYVGGEDRIGGEDDVSSLIMKYNGVPDKKGNMPYDFSMIRFENAGKRNDNSDDPIEKASASLVRKLAADGNFEEFEKYIPVSGSEAKQMYDDVRAGLGLNESMLNEAPFGNGEIYKHNGAYLSGVINSIINDKEVQVGAKGENKIELDPFITPDKEDKLKDLLKDPSDPELVKKFNEIMQGSGVKWNNIYKGTYSGYSGDNAGGPGIGAEKDLVNNDKVKDRFIKLITPYMKDKYGDIKNISVKDIRHIGGANSRRGVTFESLFNESGLFLGKTEGPSTGESIADNVYVLNIETSKGNVEEPIYISVKDGPTVSPINLGISKVPVETIIDSLTTFVTEDEKELLTKVINLRGTTDPGIDAINKQGERVVDWYYILPKNELNVENYKNALINSYGNNYYYYHVGKGEVKKFKEVSEITSELNKHKVTDARMTVTHARIVVEFKLGSNYCRLFIRRKGGTSLYLLSEVLEGRTDAVNFKGTKIDNLKDYEFK